MTINYTQIRDHISISDNNININPRNNIDPEKLVSILAARAHECAVHGNCVQF